MAKKKLSRDQKRLKQLRAQAAKASNDDTRRTLASHLELHGATSDALELVSAIAKPTAVDLYVRGRLHIAHDNFIHAAADIETSLLQQPSSAAFHLKSELLGRSTSGPESNLARLNALQQAVRLPECPQSAFTDLFRLSQGSATGAKLEELTMLIEEALTVYPHYEELRLDLAEFFLLSAPGRGFLIAAPLIEREIPSRRALWIGVQANIIMTRYEAAMDCLALMPEVVQKTAGFYKVKGDCLLARGKARDALDEYEKEHRRVTVEGITLGVAVSYASLAVAHHHVGNWEPAVENARKAAQEFFTLGIADMRKVPFWLEHARHYDYRPALEKAAQIVRQSRDEQSQSIRS